MPNLIFDINNDPGPEETAMHNLQVWLHGVRKIGKEAMGKPRKISITVRDENEKVIGGVLANIQMKIFIIEAAWVAEEHRRKGVGRALKEKYVAAARENNCEYIMGSTYEFYNSLEFNAKEDKEMKLVAKIENAPTPYTLYIVARKL